MKINYLLLVTAVAALSSCSTAYRSGQTPDDVYYSPAPVLQQNSYVSTENNKDKNSYSYRNEEESDIRRGIDNPIYRSPVSLSLSMGYGYSPYSLFPYNSFSNPFYNPYGSSYYGYDPFTPYAYNPYYGLKGGLYNPYQSFIYNDMTFYSPYNFGYSPYSFGYSPYYNYNNFYSPILFSTKTVNTNTGPRRYNLNPYNTESNSRNDQPIRNTVTGVEPRGSGVGNVIRRVFTPQQSRTYVTPNNNTNRTYEARSYNENNSNQTPQRTFNNNNYNNTPSVSTPSSSGSGNSSSAPVRSFRR
jgi:hypothetical protein